MTIYKRFFIGTFSLVILIGFVVGFIQFYQTTQKEKRSPQSPVAADSTGRRPAPAFALQDSSGQKHALEELRGSLVVLHFWAAWCPPCIEEIPQWIELAQKFQKQPIRFVSISVDPGWAEALRVFPGEKATLPLLSLLDATAKLPEAYGTYQFPETYLIGPDLTVLSKWVGPQSWLDPKIEHQLRRLLMAF